MNVIEVQNLSKKYSIAREKYHNVTLRDNISSLLNFSFIKNRGNKSIRDYWALKNINFCVRKGEVVGIIGPNGAGKSTLLKILSSITLPTTGKAVIRGQVASLLEIGTGFNPELSGKENIYLNGAILGMKKNEIDKKLDEIVEFSGVEKFLDTPVKRYSSGMFVRLAFSVAAHMEPEILLIDEVLSVGDIGFQKKCLSKINNLVKEKGRTILFVSHNLGAVKSLCSRSILISNGSVQKIGYSVEVINSYMQQEEINTESTETVDKENRRGDGPVIITGFNVLDEKGSALNFIATGENVYFEISYKYKFKDNLKKIEDFIVDVSFYTRYMQYLTSVNSKLSSLKFKDLPASGKVYCYIPRFPLMANEYVLSLNLKIKGFLSDQVQNIKRLKVITGDYYRTGIQVNFHKHGVCIDHRWLENIE